MILDFYPEQIRQQLERELPGEEAQLRMAPPFRGKLPRAENCSNASVLIMLYPDGRSGTRLVFMKRNEYPGPHSGQISFPGGMQEEGENDLVITALREAEEETGVPADRIEILGKLTPLYIPVSNICVHPYTGWIPFVPKFVPDQTEVEYLITPRVSDLFNLKNHQLTRFNYQNRDHEAPCLLLDGEVVWGATAMMLSEFMAVIERML